ncbi:PHD/FYVE-zinc-finger like domain-containing protein [Chaetomidium leptoderma]|uniref:PHD/FYVE-zinc-finger like domain-containing protein n=1 Tax=Chaetomidium leptoderma TaxID=669021 RepID=A0AAN6VM76_9PEZI|nr:PHD/FYVE-zinc-finger like domain-containing protein [Chaetomidium leptoderma]
METTHGFLSSDDELFVNGATEDPAPFTFQSDLSDDDMPDPLNLDETARETLAALNGTLDSPQKDEPEPRPTTKDGIANNVAVPPADKPRKGVTSVGIEVRLPWLPPAQRAGYQKIKVEYYRPTEDEHLGTRRRRRRDDEYDYDEQFDTRKRKRHDDDYASYDDFDEDSVDDDDDGHNLENHRGSRLRRGPIDDYLGTGNGRRSTRASTRASSHIVSSEGEHGHLAEMGRGLRLRPRASVAFNQSSQYDDRDELQDSDADPNDPTFAFVKSDIVQTKRKRLKKMSTGGRLVARGVLLDGDSDIGFESRRRSSRANKITRSMADNYLDDDDIYYIDEEKAPTAPRVLGMREVFQTASLEFKEAHRTVCDSCSYGDDRNKGPLIPCQGCSNSYHKACLGTRSVRDQRVTKVAPDSFVMQCRFCVCIYKKKDVRAPQHDLCQGCNTKNRSCMPFSERKTPKQEEALRNENDGVDPITPVDPKLVNNPDNVLFRCGRCHRAWHYEHLPHPNRSRDPAIDDPLNLRKHRREEYQITWMCKGCQDTEEEKVDKIVAWRPLDPKTYTKGQWITDFDEDNLEYLLKWEHKSHNHCIWMPGAWVYGVVKATMRLSFVKRTFGEGSDEGIEGDRQHADSLLRWTDKEAIHDVWLTPDIILDAHYAPRSREDEKKYKAKSAQDKFEDDLSRVHHVIKIYVKFEGLGYDDAVWDTPPAPDAGPIYDAFREAYREFLNGKHFRSEPWRQMKERIEDFRQLDFSTGIEVKHQPKGLQRGKLMEYQLEGLNWMLYNFRHERSVILADEMGLGKTVQVVALLSSFIQDSPKIWPFLIVVPNATCANWRREIKKWAPDLRVVAYYGGRVSQSLALQYELFPNGTRDMKAHVVIMSYDSAKDNDTRLRFANTKWAGLIVDEAQALKNDENTLYRALNALRIPFKLLLTGTPLQNNKRELFNLLQFIDPSMRAERLDEEFAQITSENLPQLHELIRPYFLRRTKALVLTFLPPMAQIIVPVSMSVLQERLCKSIMERNPQLIRSVFVQSKMKASERGSLSNILMQLRKCLCHPFIYSQAIEDRTTSPELTRRNLVEASSKLMLLGIMLPKLKERGHRVLLFSQFLDQLTILEDFMAGMGLRHERLDGNQSSMEKQKKIDAFNAPDSDIFAMLLSTRAGGVGINLATADTVIILDPDWNPHQDIQALSRAHRIGQRKKVLCFQLMTVDSAEEKILQIGRKKLALDHLLIETMDNEEEAPNDVESVLKHGAAALFGEGKKKDAITYDSAAVDKLLDRSMTEETKTNEDKSAESAFAFARIWANDEGALAEDMQETEQTMNLGVWDQILQQRAEEAQREAERNMETLGRGGRRRGAANYTGPRFEFDENQAAAAESDQADVDDDFVGSDKSEAESSDEDTAVTGESTPTGANSRKGQGKGNQADSEPDDAQDDAQDAALQKARSHPRNPKATQVGQKATTVAVLRPPPNQDAPPRKKDGSSSGRRHQQQEDATTAPAQAGGGGGGARRVNGGSTQQQPTTNQVAAYRPASSSNGPRPPSRGSNLVQVALPGGKVMWTFVELVSDDSTTTTTPVLSVVPTLISTTPIPVPKFPPPSSFSSFSGPPRPSIDGGGPGPGPILLPSSGPGPNPNPDFGPGPDPAPDAASKPEPSDQVCFVCHYRHPATWQCPEMESEVTLRVLIDQLKQEWSAKQEGGGGKAGEVVMRRLRFLKGKLRKVKGGGGNGGG